MVVCAGLYPLSDADSGDLYRFGVYRKRSDCFGWLRESDISRADNGGWCLSVKFAGHSEGKELKKLVAHAHVDDIRLLSFSRRGAFIVFTRSPCRVLYRAVCVS